MVKEFMKMFSFNSMSERDIALDILLDFCHKEPSSPHCRELHALEGILQEIIVEHKHEAQKKK